MCAILYRIEGAGECCRLTGRLHTQADRGTAMSEVNADYAQEVSVRREHDRLDLRVVAWARECSDYGRTCSSKKEVNTAESISEIPLKKEETMVFTLRGPRGQT